MTLDEKLVRSVDRVVKKTHTTRSAFTRDALRDALAKYNIARLEWQHQQPYTSGQIETTRAIEPISFVPLFGLAPPSHNIVFLKALLIRVF